MLKVITFAAVAVTLAGCASITKGTQQTLIFNLEPEQTRCVMTRDGDGEIGSITTKNNTLTVGKDKDDIIVKSNADGYQQKVIRLTSSAETAGVVGVALDLGITDMITGAMWSYPNQTNIALEKSK